MSGNGRRQALTNGSPSLTGDLAMFRAYDVCQFLSLSRSSGALLIRAAGVRGAIYFEEGRVVAARLKPNPQRLGRLLRSAGAVDEPALARALAAQIAGDRRPLGEMLLGAGAVTAAALAGALAAQAREALTVLLILPAGRFAFARAVEPAPGERWLSGVDPQALVLDALARLDELAAGRGARASEAGAEPAPPGA
jgi:hypothetical protein